MWHTLCDSISGEKWKTLPFSTCLYEITHIRSVKGTTWFRISTPTYVCVIRGKCEHDFQTIHENYSPISFLRISKKDSRLSFAVAQVGLIFNYYILHEARLHAFNIENRLEKTRFARWEIRGREFSFSNTLRWPDVPTEKGETCIGTYTYETKSVFPRHPIFFALFSLYTTISSRLSLWLNRRKEKKRKEEEEKEKKIGTTSYTKNFDLSKSKQ